MVGCLTLLAACGGKKGAEGEKAAKPTGQVLAEVNGAAITTDEFKKELDNLPPYLKSMADTYEGRKEMLETMVIRELILQEAAKDKTEESQLVKDKLAELKKRVVVEAFLKKKVEAEANISDADLQKFYDQNKDKFKHGDQIRASHILVKDDKQIQEVQAALQKGEKFEDLAKKHSIDSAAGKGGDLGWFGKGSMLPEFEKAAFALTEGQVSAPVKTKFGTHLIKLTGKRAAGVMPFADVKEQIKQAIMPTKQKEIFDKLKDDLKKNAKYSIKEDALKGMGGAAEAPEGAKPTEGAAEKSAPPAATEKK
jgi:peptidyl-prolyl cis-trans isomerase C